MGKWEEVRAIRELMSNNNVGKDAGYSWIESKNDHGSLEFDDLRILPSR